MSRAWLLLWVCVALWPCSTLRALEAPDLHVLAGTENQAGRDIAISDDWIGVAYTQSLRVSYGLQRRILPWTAPVTLRKLVAGDGGFYAAGFDALVHYRFDPQRGWTSHDLVADLIAERRFGEPKLLLHDGTQLLLWSAQGLLSGRAGGWQWRAGASDGIYLGPDGIEPYGSGFPDRKPPWDSRLRVLDAKWHRSQLWVLLSDGQVFRNAELQATLPVSKARALAIGPDGPIIGSQQGALYLNTRMSPIQVDPTPIVALDYSARTGLVVLTENAAWRGELATPWSVLGTRQGLHGEPNKALWRDGRLLVVLRSHLISLDPLTLRSERLAISEESEFSDAVRLADENVLISSAGRILMLDRTDRYRELARLRSYEISLGADAQHAYLVADTGIAVLETRPPYRLTRLDSDALRESLAVFASTSTIYVTIIGSAPLRLPLNAQSGAEAEPIPELATDSSAGAAVFPLAGSMYGVRGRKVVVLEGRGELAAALAGIDFDSDGPVRVAEHGPYAAVTDSQRLWVSRGQGLEPLMLPMAGNAGINDLEIYIESDRPRLLIAATNGKVYSRDLSAPIQAAAPLSVLLRCAHEAHAPAVAAPRAVLSEFFDAITRPLISELNPIHRCSFVANSYESPVQYQLRGAVESDWSRVKRIAVSVPAGQQQLQVWARDRLGRQGSATIALDGPPMKSTILQQSLRAMMLAVLLALVGIALLSWRNRQSQRRQAELAVQVSERTAELTEVLNRREEVIAERTAQLTQALAEAERTRNAKARMLANTSHEIRTPLNGILGTLQLMLQRPRGDTDQRDLALIERCAQNLNLLIADLLDSSQIENDSLRLEFADFDLHRLLRDVLAILRPLAEGRGLRLIQHLDPACANIWHGDAKRIRQILINLLGNAIKFTERGQVELVVQSDVTDGLIFMVKDSGIGISTADQARIFEPFVQVDARVSRRFEGTGLGLHITRSLIERMNGSITLDSAPGQGSCFRVALPLKAVARTGRAESPAAITAPPQMFPGIHVLVVDDVDTNRMVLSAQLMFLGATVDTAEDGPTALTMLSKRNYHLALIDCQMPGMDGMELTRQLLAKPGPQPYVVAASATDLPAVREECRAAGMQGFLGKPISLPALQSVLSHVAALHAGNPA
ncbi:MAG: ATP-binding protein [Xanthomonadales bacterium]|jgi:signal transduction histidine kinase|nr:ATP-binding protein [Xanthomonadales bacterium]